MPVTTTISEKDFKEILSHYNLGEYESFKTFANGAGQTTILLVSSGGKHVLRYYENRTEKHVLFEVNLFSYLKEQGYPVPAIIKTSDGQPYGSYKGKSFLLLEYIEGEHPKNPNDFFDEASTSQVIGAIARLHSITEHYHPSYFDDREEFNAEYAWREYPKIPRTIDKEKRAAWFKKELDALEFPAGLPRGICHADVNHGNFLLRDGKVAAVLDFDMSLYTYVIYDVASLIYWWTFPPQDGLREKQARFIVSEYSKHRSLSEEEKRHIFDALKLIILLGIAWSEEGDFESSQKAVEFLNSLGREGFYEKLR